MWIPEIPPSAGWLAGAVVAVAAVSPAQAAENYAMEVCRYATQPEGVEIRPTYAADSYLYEYRRDYALHRKFSFDSNSTKITLIKAPKHGKMALADVPDVSSSQYHYTPKEGYAGRDRFVMSVEKDGIKVRLEYLIEVIPEGEPIYISGDNGRVSPYCHPVEHWKINVIPVGNADLAALLTNAADNVSFSNLSGASVGQTIGTGAAGHGWYIDYTPYLNDEYLPTSNPLEWIAKPGSEAEGKMDMLTVLLHENNRGQTTVY